MKELRFLKPRYSDFAKITGAHKHRNDMQRLARMLSTKSVRGKLGSLAKQFIYQNMRRSILSGGTNQKYSKSYAKMRREAGLRAGKVKMIAKKGKSHAFTAVFKPTLSFKSGGLKEQSALVRPRKLKVTDSITGRKKKRTLYEIFQIQADKGYNPVELNQSDENKLFSRFLIYLNKRAFKIFGYDIF